LYLLFFVKLKPDLWWWWCFRLRSECTQEVLGESS